MHSRKTGIKGLILILAGLVALAAIAVVPTFGGGTSHAGPGTGINLNRSAAITSFIIPGVPVTTLAVALPATTAPIKMTLAGAVATTFPVTSGELLLDKTELVVWDLSASCGALGANDVCVTTRAKVGTLQTHAIGKRVQIATQLTSAINDTTDAVQADLELGGTGSQANPPQAVTATAQPPFSIQLGAGQAAAFGTTGFLTIAHSGIVLNLSSEYLEYNNADAGCTLAADQLCISATTTAGRALQPGNDKRAHLADGFNQPCVSNLALTCSPAGKTTGTSIVTKHFQLNVKSTAGFFPTGPLVIGGEIINFNNAADKIKTPPSTQFHAVTRGGFVATLEPTTVSTHAIGSIVTGAHAQLVCRNGTVQPGVDTLPGQANPGVQEPGGQLLGTSVAIYPVCMTRTQPAGAPKTFPGTSAATLDIPIIGSTLIVLSAVAIPFLSTGGLIGTVFGDIPQVDANGTDDGSLVLTSPCIEDFSPGTNLKVDITLDTSDNTFTTPDLGSIKVVLDTIPGPGGGPDGDVLTHDDCDDPAGLGALTSTTYSFYEPTNIEDPLSVDSPSTTIVEGPGPCDDGINNGGGTLAENSVDLKTDIFDSDCYDLRAGFSHDTDSDGCSDLEELNPDQGLGGRRDPWNGNDFYDVNKDGTVDVLNDILPVILAFLQGPGDALYTTNKDGGLLIGPFAQHKGDPDETIDVLNDILGVILSFLHDCRNGP